MMIRPPRPMALPMKYLSSSHKSPLNCFGRPRHLNTIAMAPFKPLHIYTGQITIESFGGILTHLTPPPGRSFCSRQTYRAFPKDPVDEQAQKVLERGGKPSSPPPHLHRYQTEYFKVKQGLKGVNISGKITTTTSEDLEYIIPTN